MGLRKRGSSLENYVRKLHSKFSQKYRYIVVLFNNSLWHAQFLRRLRYNSRKNIGIFMQVRHIATPFHTYS